MAKQYWLVKSEPGAYSWDTFVGEGGSMWDGVRNYQARNNLKKMAQGDQVLFYHSVNGKEIVGVAEVTREHYPDPTAEGDKWVVTDLKPVAPLKRPVSLEEVKADPKLAEMVLARNSRLSVMPVTGAEFRRILSLGKTKL